MSRRRHGWLIASLAIINILGVYIALATLMFLPVPASNRELVSMLLGNIVGFAAAIITFHFGSSAESAEKNQTIDTQAQTLKAAQEALAPLPGAPDLVIPPGGTATVAATGDSDAQASKPNDLSSP